MELKNRLIRSATHEGMADKKGFPTESLFKLYARLARGGVGLIITGYAYICPDGRSPYYRMLGIDKDDFIPKYYKLVQRVHQNGAKIAMQIAHCGRQTTEKSTGYQPIAPSAVEDKLYSPAPREMTEEDMERIIEAFAQASRRAKESGFDAVQLHGAHGYLISEFLSPHTNRRTDRWGGSIENRMRFVQKVYERCRDHVGSEYPILVKMNAYDKMKNGLKIEESILMAKMMEEMGFDGIEVSCGIDEDGGSVLMGDAPWGTKPDQAYNRQSAKAIKCNLNIPVFVVGGITDPAAMEDIVENGDADYISLCRALISEPKFPEKIQKGSRKPARCIHCLLCTEYLPYYPLHCYHGKRISESGV